MMSSGAFAPFRLANRHGGLILKYHRFSEGPDARAISRRAFTEHLRYLSRRYTIVDLRAMVAHLSAGSRPSRPFAAITIDDGHADAYDIALPVLRQFGTPATLFVVTGFLDGTCWLWADHVRYVIARTTRPRVSLQLGTESMNLTLEDRDDRVAAASRINDRLKQLPEHVRRDALNTTACALGVEIPSLPPAEYAPITWAQALEMKANRIAVEPHTVTHPILTKVSAEQLRREVTESKARVEEMLGGRATTFCYPSGRWNRGVREIVEGAGYECVVTTSAGFNPPGIDPYCLRRFSADEALARFAKTTSGFENWERALRQTGSRLAGLW